MSDSSSSIVSRPVSPVLRILLVIVFFVSFGQLAAWMNRSGATWWLLGPRLSHAAGYQINSALFERLDDSSSPTCILVGDHAFLDSVEEALSEEDRVQSVLMPRWSYAKIAALMDNLEVDSVDLIILQTHPLAWSNYRFRGGSPNLDIWSRHHAESWSLYPLEDVRVLFRAVEDFVSSRQLDRGAPDRDLNLDELRFSPARGDREQVIDAIAHHGPRRLIWLEDLRGVDLASNPNLHRDVQDFYAEPDTRENLGMFLSLDDFADRAADLLKGCRSGRSVSGDREA